MDNTVHMPNIGVKNKVRILFGSDGFSRIGRMERQPTGFRSAVATQMRRALSTLRGVAVFNSRGVPLRIQRVPTSGVEADSGLRAEFESREGLITARSFRSTYSSSCEPAPIRWRCFRAIAARSSVLASNQWSINASMTRFGFDSCCAQSSSKAAKVLLSKRYVR